MSIAKLKVMMVTEVVMILSLRIIIFKFFFPVVCPCLSTKFIHQINPIPKFTQISKISPFFSGLFCFVILTFNINLNIFLDLKTFQNTFITTIYSSTFTKLSGVRISALYLILNGTKEEHLNMLEGGIIAKLLDEKWSTFAKVVSST